MWETCGSKFNCIYMYDPSTTKVYYSVFIQVSKLDAHILRLEQKLDEKDQDLYHARLEARNKAKYLKQTIQDLRRQFSGSLPLLKQERFAEAMRSLQESKLKLQEDLDKVSINYRGRLFKAGLKLILG